MERKLETGSTILYIDSRREAHHALVTAVWPAYATTPEAPPGCNLVLVSDDVQAHDPYGRQIARETSVVHLTQNPGGGNAWCWADEWSEPVKLG